MSTLLPFPHSLLSYAILPHPCSPPPHALSPPPTHALLPHPFTLFLPYACSPPMEEDGSFVFSTMYNSFLTESIIDIMDIIYSPLPSAN
jgi:hypothetical protein